MGQWTLWTGFLPYEVRELTEHRRHAGVCRGCYLRSGPQNTAVVRRSAVQRTMEERARAHSRVLLCVCSSSSKASHKIRRDYGLCFQASEEDERTGSLQDAVATIQASLLSSLCLCLQLGMVFPDACGGGDQLAQKQQHAGSHVVGAAARGN